MKKHQGYALLTTVAMLMIIFIFSLGAVLYLRTQRDMIASRTARIQRLVSAVEEVLLRQLVIYPSGVNEYYLALEDKTRSDGEREALKSAALARWFSREELEARNRYTYEEIRERFGSAKFWAVDEASSSTALRIEKFELSVPSEDTVYDMNGFLIAGRLIVEIEMESGYPLGLLLSGYKKHDKGAGDRSAVTEIWDDGGVVITIPIKIGGDGKNFWTN
jgi:hypothetical protein